MEILKILDRAQRATRGSSGISITKEKLLLNGSNHPTYSTTKDMKLYALIENGKLCHFYSLAFVMFTRKQAEIERKYYNELGHKMKVVPIEISLPTH